MTGIPHCVDWDTAGRGSAGVPDTPIRSAAVPKTIGPLQVNLSPVAARFGAWKVMG